MIKYNPKNWFGLIFKFHKQETFRQLFWIMVSIALFASLVCFFEIEVFKLRYTSSTVVHSILGFIISMLLVFRTNTAYDRWWEGRKNWGALVNVSRNMAIKVCALLDESQPAEKEQMLRLIKAYSFALKEHLRNKKSKKLNNLLPDGISCPLDVEHIPNYLASQMQRLLLSWHQQKNISEAQYYTLQKDLDTFTDICGACERIKNTPIPYTYNIFIKKFLFVYTMTMPFGFVSTFGYWAIGITVFTFYALASLEIIAEEIEDPFGEDPNDLPTDGLAKTISKNIDELERA